MMENGVGVDDGSHWGENVLENEILESRVEETAVVGSDEPTDSDGDDVFEEAIHTDTPRVYDAGFAVNRDDNVGKVVHLAGSAEVVEKSDLGNDTEQFEEAIGGPVVVLNHKEELPVYSDDRTGSLVTGEPSDEVPVGGVIDVESVTDNVGKDELNGMEDDVTASVVEDKEKEKEISSVTGASEEGVLKDWSRVDEESGIVAEKHENGEEGVLKDWSQVDKESGIVAEKHENGDIVNLDGMQVGEKSETGAAHILQGQGVNPDSPQGVESTGDILHHDEESGGVKETMGLLDSPRHAEQSYDDEDIIASAVHTDEPDEMNEILVNLNSVIQEEKSLELEKEASESPVLSYHDDKTEEQMHNGYLGSENQDEKSRESTLTSATADSSYSGDSWKPNGKLCTVDERTLTTTANEMLTSEDSVVHDDEKIAVSETDFGIRKFEGSQLQHTGSDVEASNAVIKEPENRAKGGVVKESSQGNGSREINTAPNAFLSSGKSAHPAPPFAHPAGLGRAAPLLESAPRVVQQPRVNGTLSEMQNQLSDDPSNREVEDNDETREQLQRIRVKFLRLARRLGQTPHNVVVAQVLYRLGLAEQLRGRNGGRVAAFSFDRASAMAEQLEAAGQEPLDFSCTILVLGKTGIGKSATINSIFDEVKFGTDAFQPGTKKVQDVVGTVQGIEVRVIDTPGLLPSWSDQRQNEKILLSVKQFIKKTPPDIVLYLDRLDMQSRDFGDMPLLRTISDIFGPSIWFNAIVVLTHAASAPPEGPNGTTTSYDLFVTQRSHVVQQAIRQAAGDMRLMNPVSLVENHSACRTNRAGQRVLPNGQVWKPHLLLLSFASKILAEANTLLKMQDSPPGKPFSARTKAPSLPFLLSSLLQSRPQLKLPEEQLGDDDTLDDDLVESSDSDGESEYDQLPPFKRLTKAELAKLSKTQKNAYYDELEYREKLFMEKQLKEEKKRRKMRKNVAALSKDLPSEIIEEVEEESSGAASVPVPLPDLALPASFDSDNPSHRYRFLDSPNQWLVRPVLDTHGWDHDIGYEGVNLERMFVVKQEIPVAFSGQVTKDKKDANLQMEIASSIKHGEGKATSLCLDMQTLGKDIAYTMRGETRFSNYRRNKATAGLSVTVLGDALTAGVKVEDKLIVNNRFRMVVSGGAMAGRGDVAYGGSLEATLRDKDHPLGRSLSTFGLSVMDWHGDLAIGGNLQSQIPVGRLTNLIARANLNNRGSGQVSVRLNSSEQLQIALIGVLPLLKKLLVVLRNCSLDNDEN